MKKYFFLVMMSGSLPVMNSLLQAQCTPVSVPFYEDFQNIQSNNQLPSCWSASGPGSTCLTFTGSNSYAGFFASPTGSNYFYTRGITLNAGVTYSAAVWKRVDVSGSSNWTDLSLMLGTSQSPVALSSIVSSGGAVTNTVYAPFNGTFTVPSGGTYYLAIRAISTATATSQYLYFDDVSVTVPCNAAPNSPQLNITASSTVVCAGAANGATVSASGADTYTWNSGQNTSTIVYNGAGSSLLSVAGTKTLSGCTSNATIFIGVNPAPVVTAFAQNAFVCAGTGVQLSAAGAASYQWSNGVPTATQIVSPLNNTVYAVTGSYTTGCSANATVSVNVHLLPVVTINPGSATLCAGESLVIFAGGATSYTWSHIAAPAPGFSVSINPLTTSNYTVTGLDQNGCVNSATAAVVIDICASVNDEKPETPRFYPNPNKGLLYLTVEPSRKNELRIFDLQGRELLHIKLLPDEQHAEIEMTGLEAGAYYLQLTDGMKKITRKIMKE